MGMLPASPTCCCSLPLRLPHPLPLLPLPPPAGPRSSALVGGYTSWHRELEAALAQLKGTEECLLFPTGFAANLAVASALCQEGGVVVLSDELNHASIVDGARLGRRGGSRLLVYRHNDMAHLEELLQTQCPPGAARCAAAAAVAATRLCIGSGAVGSTQCLPARRCLCDVTKMAPPCMLAPCLPALAVAVAQACVRL